MSATLFGFSVANPVDMSGAAFSDYDAKSQTAVWSGGATDVAISCCYVPFQSNGCQTMGRSCYRTYSGQRICD